MVSYMTSPAAVARLPTRHKDDILFPFLRCLFCYSIPWISTSQLPDFHPLFRLRLLSLSSSYGIVTDDDLTPLSLSPSLLFFMVVVMLAGGC